MNSIYTLINTKRLHIFSWSLVLLISFREDFKVNAQGLSDNSGEYSQNSLMAYVVVSSLGVAVTIMFLCYLYLREQTECCCKKRKNLSQDLQATNTVDIAHSEIYSGVYHYSSGNKILSSFFYIKNLIIKYMQSYILNF